MSNNKALIQNVYLYLITRISVWAILAGLFWGCEDSVPRPYLEKDTQPQESRTIDEGNILTQAELNPQKHQLDDLTYFNSPNLKVVGDFVYISVPDDAKIYVSDLNLQPQETISFRKPENDPQLTGILDFAVLQDEFVVLNNGLGKGSVRQPNQLLWFSRQGEFKSEFAIQGMDAQRLAVIDNRQFVVKSLNDGAYLFRRYNLEQGKMSSFQPKGNQETDMIFLGTMALQNNDHLYFGGYSEPILKKYDLHSGKLLFSRAVIDDYPSDYNYSTNTGGEFKAHLTPGALFATRALAVHGDHIFTTRDNNGDARYKTLDIYSVENGEYERSILTKYIPVYQGLDVVGDKIYSLEEEAGHFYIVVYANPF